MNKRTDATREFTCVATNVSLNFADSKGLKQMLHQKASYQVIPCTTQAFYGDVWKIIIDILPLSKNVLLDICLPFNHSVRGKTNSHTARFMLLNNKILGIKIRTGPLWSRYSSQQYRLPQEILNYYKKSDENLALTPSRCLVGEFYINHRNLKIVPLFSSEIQQNPDILTEYERYGCDIFSVVDDIAFDNITDVSTVARKLVSKNDAKSCPIIFTGCKTSTNPVKCYWTNSFIIQGQNKKQVYHNPFLPFTNIALNINVEECVKYRNYIEIERFIQNYKEGDQIIKDLSTKQQFIRFAYPFTFESDEKKLPEFKADSNLKKSILYLWFLYNRCNHKNPFTIGVPFTQTVMALAYLVNDMKNFAKNYVKFDRPLLRIYHYPNTDPRKQNFWPASLEVCNQARFYESIDNMLMNERFNNLYVYCDNIEQFRVFKDKTNSHKNIFICKSMLVDKFIVDKKVERTYLRKNQSMAIETSASKSLETLCSQILNKKYLTLQSMYKHFTAKDPSVENLVKAFTQIMPQKIRINMNLTPPHNYLLEAPKERIEKQLKEIQIKLIKPSGMKPGMEEQKPNVVDLQTKLNQIKENKLSLKKQFIICHCCQQILKKNYVKTCQKCRNQICLECTSKKIANRNMQLAQFERLIASNCPYCNQTCRCRLCVNKMERRDEQQERKRKKYLLSDYCISSCFKCQVSQRTRKAIQIQCQSCHKAFCLQCLKIEEGLTPKYYERWTCKQCRDILVLRKERSRIEVEQQKQRQMNFQILPHETGQALRQSIINDQKNSLIAEVEAISIQINKPKQKKKRSQQSSASRSRKKNRDKKNKSNSSDSSSSGSSSSGSSSSSSSSSSQSKQKPKKKQEKKKTIEKKASSQSQKVQMSQQAPKEGSNFYRNFNNEDKGNRNYSQNKPNFKPKQQNYQKYGQKKWGGQNDKTRNTWYNKNKDEKSDREQGEKGLWNATGSKDFNSRDNQRRQDNSIFQVDNTKLSNYEEPIDY